MDQSPWSPLLPWFCVSIELSWGADGLIPLCAAAADDEYVGQRRIGRRIMMTGGGY